MMPSAVRDLLRLDASLLDDWPPFLDLGLLKRGKRRGRQLMAGWQVL